jgi:hypothetical protein
VLPEFKEVSPGAKYHALDFVFVERTRFSRLVGPGKIVELKKVVGAGFV